MTLVRPAFGIEEVVLLSPLVDMRSLGDDLAKAIPDGALRCQLFSCYEINLEVIDGTGA